ncbi:diaminopimelate epimerase [Actinocrinis puniceicyclus]|uniref:Diaminopimelate epimerase n=1 Tax=Actinocrinis puniceicyclus TaxID=977794 RepID=A0A8J8BA06_9ACTN|nr:diaminopimelate epimerase [Actinocrinis puniceicyclus]MBS2961583.1 diaminopimelate epimerase [Actinocrinis puniceicyclus]
MIRYTKGHGTQNDFVILPDPEGALALEPAWVAALCDRRAGLGADGVLRVVATAKMPGYEGDASLAPWFMDYHNGDGSIAEMCGNGVRVFARYLADQGLAEPGSFGVATRGGIKTVRVPADGGDVTVDMGVPVWPHGAARIAWNGLEAQSVHVDMGNPHAVVFVDDVAQAGPLTAAPTWEPVAVYPRGVNVEFVAPLGPQHIAMRVYERGVGETRSCGTGACAAMIAAARRDGSRPGTPYTVDVPGGRLSIVEREDGCVEMTGPAVLVADGELRDFAVARG